MNSITRLHCRIQVVGQSDSAYAVGTRLQTDIEQRVADAYDAALEQAFAGDPSVYVMRNLSLCLNLPLFRQDTSRFAQQVAGKMASAAQRKALMDDEIMRFENQADYTAHFIADLLDGHAWDSWLYGPFRRFRALPLQQLLRTLLLEDPEILAETLTRLRDMHQLDPLLKTLPHATQMEMWDQLYRPGRRSDEPLPDAWRPFYAAARELLDRLGMKQDERPDLESLLRRMPNGLSVPPDWLDRQALASAVMEMFLLLSQHGHVGLRQEFLLNEQEAFASLNAAIQPLDWLDRDYLKQELLHWLVKQSKAQDTQSFGSRPAVVTPRQAKCLADLLAALQAQGIDLNRLRPASAENALRLLTTLSDGAPHWQKDSLPPYLIAILLDAWEALSHAFQPDHALQALRQSDLEKALKSVPPVHRDRAQSHFKELLRLGPTAITILGLIGEKDLPAALALPSVETRCAGVALLLRSVLNAHLPFLLKNNGFPDPSLSPEHRLQTVLLRCFEAWAGPKPEANARPENAYTQARSPYNPGFLLLAGADANAETQTFFPEFSLSDLATFQPVWEEELAGLRMDPAGDLAEDLLRLWARWLRGFAESSVPFLLENFIHRPGTVFASPTEITVVMAPRPLDLVLEMAGYLAPIENVSWLGGRRLRFTIASDESFGG